MLTLIDVDNVVFTIYLQMLNICHNKYFMVVDHFICFLSILCIYIYYVLKKMQNPGYMKDNFVICIESLHVGDTGLQSNVSFIWCGICCCFVYVNLI